MFFFLHSYVHMQFTPVSPYFFVLVFYFTLEKHLFLRVCALEDARVYAFEYTTIADKMKSKKKENKRNSHIHGKYCINHQ